MPYLDEYTGSWSAIQARHLLKRTTFGPSVQMVDTSIGLGLNGTIETLFAPLPMPDPPLKSIPDGTGNNQLNDPGALYGETWVNAAPFPNINPPMLRNRVLRSRSKSLYSWTVLQMHYSGISIREKLTLFWHNHFVVADATIAHREYLYYSLLRRFATGNFKELAKEITIDTSMLFYLSGAENTNNAPNENYSRELLELFTVGKGDLVAPGDYTNYTEDDVIQMAKVLTGWRVLPVSNQNTLTAQFVNANHTQGNKQLSHRFNNTVISENGEQEFRDLIDVIFQQEECSRFIMRKLYRWFVHNNISEDIEMNIIEPLAAIIRDSNYEIAPALKVLLKSEHFYDATACIIKNPMDLMMSVTRGLGINPPQGEVEDEYDYAYNHYIMSTDLEQALFYHPDVAGWKAYYQEPQFDKLWINNLLLPKRHEFCRLIVEGGIFSYNDENYRVTSLVPVLEIVKNIPDANDPNVLVNKLAEIMFNYPITTNQLTSLKDVLIPGLPDFEWTVEYSDYLADPSNQALEESVENKLKSLFSVMVRMSEFQIM
ncbi:MAG: DUF1800 domain-containing protein [Saprospiraceae bacterium]|nr:DUF1800 domain-containing protein [Saprospiraceae bacterium]MBK7523128.1 DUF1800 domain-containing protein [Saprospiraceae bacterium]MBK8079225.1 DUF1800 domain-containing protein [Saprospiraceae bacterium]MBK8370802.1 DUF1800 domain-containing protein [Saprospiraceae bacterium]MBK8547145.1 DUF1800 domain-containing protein [Saprospiraceae bacterium]